MTSHGLSPEQVNRLKLLPVFYQVAYARKAVLRYNNGEIAYWSEIDGDKLADVKRRLTEKYINFRL